MIIRRLTPKQAVHELTEGSAVYILQPVDMNQKTIGEILSGDGYVIEADTAPQPETSPSRDETETEAETPAGRGEATETAEKATVAKESKGVRADHETIMEMWRQGWTVKQIREVVGCSDQTVRNHIARG